MLTRLLFFHLFMKLYLASHALEESSSPELVADEWCSRQAVVPACVQRGESVARLSLQVWPLRAGLEAPALIALAESQSAACVPYEPSCAH